MSDPIYSDPDPHAILAQVHKETKATMVVFVNHGFVCVCERSCTEPCDGCVTDEDDASMLVQGVKLRKGVSEGRLPVAAMNAAIYARSTQGIGL
jgi:hypothetical protein